MKVNVLLNVSLLQKLNVNEHKCFLNASLPQQVNVNERKYPFERIYCNKLTQMSINVLLNVSLLQQENIK